MVGWSGQNRGLKADSCGFQKLSVVYSNSKNSGGQTHPKFAPKTMKPCQQTKTPLWVRSRPLDSPESEFNVRKSQDDGLPLEPCAISGGGCLASPEREIEIFQTLRHRYTYGILCEENVCAEKNIFITKFVYDVTMFI